MCSSEMCLCNEKLGEFGGKSIFHPKKLILGLAPSAARPSVLFWQHLEGTHTVKRLQHKRHL